MDQLGILLKGLNTLSKDGVYFINGLNLYYTDHEQGREHVIFKNSANKEKDLIEFLTTYVDGVNSIIIENKN